METGEAIVIRPIADSRLSTVNFEQLEFGKYISDHMLVSDYADGQWHSPRIIPFSDITLSPAALALHYGQSVFEGMKAFSLPGGKINLFRPEKHYARFMRSLERMCMPAMPEDIFIRGLEELLKLDRDWIPSSPGSALYIRPFMFASEGRFGVKIADEYRYIVFTGPVGPAFSKPLKLKVETRYSRAARGGTGFAKCSGNYGGAFYPTQQARKEGFDQVIWTDAATHSTIEESGMMNIILVINGSIVTPPLSDSILDGITRDTLLTLAKDMLIPVEEKSISIADLQKAFEEKTITEAFGAGTAAVVSPVETIHINGIDYSLPSNLDAVMFRLKARLEDIRTGKAEDTHHWNHII